MRNRLAFALIITVVFAITAHASLQMYLDKSFTIPGTNPITQLQFADWDRDGIPEVAALSSDNVVIFSITGDSIVLAYHNDSIPANPVSILFADVTRDSIPDLVLQYVGLFSINGDTVDVLLELHDGSHSFSTTKQTTHTAGPSWTRSPENRVALDLVTGDSNFNKICISYNDTILYIPGFMGYDLDLRYRLSVFDTLPDKLSRAGGYKSYILQTPGESAVAVERGKYLSFEYMGPDRYYESDRLYLYKMLEKSNLLSVDNSSSCDCYSVDGTTTYSSSGLVTAGYFLNGDESIDYIFAWNWYHQCVYWDSPAVYCSDSGLTCATMSESGTSETNWSTLSPSFNANWPITPLPFFKNYLASVGNGKVVIVSAQSGLPTDSCLVPDANNREWAYPYGNNQLRLVTIDGRKVELWGFDEATGIDDPPIAILPQRFELSNPYPNPFNPSVTISFAVPTKGKVQVEVFNLTGQRVATLLNEVVSAGTKNIPWDASGHASGVYFFRATFEEQTKTVKAILLK